MNSDGKRVEVIFDIETKKFFDDINAHDPAALGISIVSAYRRELDNDLSEIKGEMKSFWEADFDQMWSWFEEADRIIGYNSLGFDVPAVNGVYKGDFTKLKHFDVLKIIKDVFGHRVKLDSVAKECLGQGKNASGADAVMWWAKGDPESLANLKKYCEMDVEVTKGVYDYGLKNKKLKFKDHWNELREIEVDFSYPPSEKPKVAEQQISLF
ncbi:MAG TPA: ribonuclease H-like domain-containing protein [Candidatus Woesebacteria bacterium]|nr:ribonuclease H-like domain-containing protein [Candidatus Woesebacteria bacterium]